MTIMMTMTTVIVMIAMIPNVNHDNNKDNVERVLVIQNKPTTPIAIVMTVIIKLTITFKTIS